jgi:hypothetical protein
MKWGSGWIHAFYSAKNWKLWSKTTVLFMNLACLCSCASLFLWIGLPFGFVSYERWISEPWTVGIQFWLHPDSQPVAYHHSAAHSTSVSYLEVRSVHPASYSMDTGGSFLGVKWPRREPKHSPPATAKVNNVWSYTSTSPHVFMAWCLIKYQGQPYHYSGGPEYESRIAARLYSLSCLIVFPSPIRQ